MPRVGEIFREEREQKGFTLRDIEEMTSIRYKYLEAIENGDNEVLPGEVYAKGFVRNYAIALGFDGDEFVSLYKHELEKAQNPEPAPEIPVAQVQNRQEELRQETFVPQVNEYSQEPIQVKKTSSEKKSPPERKLKIAPLVMFACVFIVAVLVGVYIILTFFHNPDQNNQQAGTARQTTETSSTTNPSNRSAAQTGDQANQSEPLFRVVNDMKGTITVVPSREAITKQLEVEAVYKSDCWTRVIADGEQIFSGMMRTGNRQKWQARENMQIRVGNVAAVDLTINGQKVEKIAEGGPVVDANISILK